MPPITVPEHRTLIYVSTDESEQGSITEFGEMMPTPVTSSTSFISAPVTVIEENYSTNSATDRQLVLSETSGSTAAYIVEKEFNNKQNTKSVPENISSIEKNQFRSESETEKYPAIIESTTLLSETKDGEYFQNHNVKGTSLPGTDKKENSAFSPDSLGNTDVPLQTSPVYIVHPFKQSSGKTSTVSPVFIVHPLTNWYQEQSTETDESPVPSPSTNVFESTLFTTKTSESFIQSTPFEMYLNENEVMSEKPTVMINTQDVSSLTEDSSNFGTTESSSITSHPNHFMKTNELRSNSNNTENQIITSFPSVRVHDSKTELAMTNISDFSTNELRDRKTSNVTTISAIDTEKLDTDIMRTVTPIIQYVFEINSTSEEELGISYSSNNHITTTDESFDKRTENTMISSLKPLTTETLEEKDSAFNNLSVVSKNLDFSLLEVTTSGKISVEKGTEESLESSTTEIMKEEIVQGTENPISVFGKTELNSKTSNAVEVTQQKKISPEIHTITSDIFETVLTEKSTTLSIPSTTAEVIEKEISSGTEKSVTIVSENIISLMSSSNSTRFEITEKEGRLVTEQPIVTSEKFYSILPESYVTETVSEEKEIKTEKSTTVSENLKLIGTALEELDNGTENPTTTVENVSNLLKPNKFKIVEEDSSFDFTTSENIELNSFKSDVIKAVHDEQSSEIRKSTVMPENFKLSSFNSTTIETIQQEIRTEDTTISPENSESSFFKPTGFKIDGVNVDDKPEKSTIVPENEVFTSPKPNVFKIAEGATETSIEESTTVPWDLEINSLETTTVKHIQKQIENKTDISEISTENRTEINQKTESENLGTPSGYLEIGVPTLVPGNLKSSSYKQNETTEVNYEYSTEASTIIHGYSEENFLNSIISKPVQEGREFKTENSITTTGYSVLSSFKPTTSTNAVNIVIEVEIENPASMSDNFVVSSFDQTTNKVIREEMKDSTITLTGEKLSESEKVTTTPGETGLSYELTTLQITKEKYEKETKAENPTTVPSDLMQNRFNPSLSGLARTEVNIVTEKLTENVTSNSFLSTTSTLEEKTNGVEYNTVPTNKELSTLEPVTFTTIHEQEIEEKEFVTPFENDQYGTSTTVDKIVMPQNDFLNKINISEIEAEAFLHEKSESATWKEETTERTVSKQMETIHRSTTNIPLQYESVIKLLSSTVSATTVTETSVLVSEQETESYFSTAGISDYSRLNTDNITESNVLTDFENKNVKIELSKQSTNKIKGGLESSTMNKLIFPFSTKSTKNEVEITEIIEGETTTIMTSADKVPITYKSSIEEEVRTIQIPERTNLLKTAVEKGITTFASGKPLSSDFGFFEKSDSTTEAVNTETITTLKHEEAIPEPSVTKMFNKMEPYIPIISVTTTSTLGTEKPIETTSNPEQEEAEIESTITEDMIMPAQNVTEIPIRITSATIQNNVDTSPLVPITLSSEQEEAEIESTVTEDETIRENATLSHIPMKITTPMFNNETESISSSDNGQNLSITIDSLTTAINTNETEANTVAVPELKNQTTPVSVVISTTENITSKTSSIGSPSNLETGSEILISTASSAADSGSEFSTLTLSDYGNSLSTVNPLTELGTNRSTSVSEIVTTEKNRYPLLGIHIPGNCTATTKELRIRNSHNKTLILITGTKIQRFNKPSTSNQYNNDCKPKLSSCLRNSDCSNGEICLNNICTLYKGTPLAKPVVPTSAGHGGIVKSY